MSIKVLLLQGPVESKGVNFLTAQLYNTQEERARVCATFNAQENIRSLSYVFRSRGYKIVYSGWSEDTAWLHTNKDLFDACCISEQKDIPDSVEFQGRTIPNNKEKLYFSLHQGLKVVAHEFGDCMVVRLRSDVAVDVNEIDKMTMTAIAYPNSILVEYADPDNVLFVPDFVTIAGLGLHLKLYGNLSKICRENGGHHISSHIDHGIEMLRLKERGELSHVICMSRSLHDSMVWRGLPRFYANHLEDASAKLFFNCLLNHPAGMNSEQILQNMHPELAGRPGGRAAKASMA
jgi:hypothetical protein